MATPSLSGSSPLASDDSRSPEPALTPPPAVRFALDCIRRHCPGQSRGEPRQRRIHQPGRRQAARQDEARRKDDVAANADDSGNKDTGEWLEISLTNHEWLILQDHIAALRRDSEQGDLWDYIEHKLRYDYFATSNLLVLRLRRICMPGRIHEFLIRQLDSHTIQQLWQLGREEQDPDGAVAQYVNRIEPWGHLRMRFQAPSSSPPPDGVGIETHDEGSKPKGTAGQHEPDCTHGVMRSDQPDYYNLHPGVIIEVATSQKRPQLLPLAEDYLLSTEAGPAVQIVLAIDIDLDAISSGEPREAAKAIEYRRQYEKT